LYDPALYDLYQRYLALPEGEPAELIDGEIILAPRPRVSHQTVAGGLAADLRTRFGGKHGKWKILAEPELHFGADIVVPDLAGWRREREVDFTGAFVADAPDWLCEVLSKSTEVLDRRRKLPLYARQRVGHVWLLKPTSKLLEIYRLDGETYRLVATFDGDEKVRAEPFDAIELDLAGLWTP
jgi:Uma2 family endonuclease